MTAVLKSPGFSTDSRMDVRDARLKELEKENRRLKPGLAAVGKNSFRPKFDALFKVE